MWPVSDSSVNWLLIWSEPHEQETCVISFFMCLCSGAWQIYQLVIMTRRLTKRRAHFWTMATCGVIATSAQMCVDEEWKCWDCDISRFIEDKPLITSVTTSLQDSQANAELWHQYVSDLGAHMKWLRSFSAEAPHAFCQIRWWRDDACYALTQSWHFAVS